MLAEDGYLSLSLSLSRYHIIDYDSFAVNKLIFI